VGTAIKYSFALCDTGNAGENGTCDSGLNLKYFIQVVKFLWPIQNLLWPTTFRQSPVAA